MQLLLQKTNIDTCPVKLLAHYCKIAELRANSDEYIFRSLQFNKKLNKNTLSGINKPLSYTRQDNFSSKFWFRLDVIKVFLGCIA